MPAITEGAPACENSPPFGASAPASAPEPASPRQLAKTHSQTNLERDGGGVSAYMQAHDHSVDVRRGSTSPRAAVNVDEPGAPPRFARVGGGGVGPGSVELAAGTGGPAEQGGPSSPRRPRPQPAD